MVKWIIIIASLIPFLGNAQNDLRTKTTKEVFENLVQAYANGKGAPELKIIPLKEKQVIAEYSTTNQGLPLIKIDQKLINICFSLGKDSLNALAFILAHELSHYYKDDNWCMDYAGFKFKTDPAFAKEIKAGEKYNLSKEVTADKEALIYSSIAGYSPFTIFNQLIDVIYLKYSLQANLYGYPSKDGRKVINKDAKKEAQKWLAVFDAGTILTYSGNYQEAIDCFTFLSKKFPSREIFNNLGSAQLLWALRIKPTASVEYIYPIEIDPTSRLISSTNNTRSIDLNNNYYDLLKLALKNFEKARQIDPNYKKVIINIACVYDLLGDFDLSIGFSKNINESEKEYVNALTIRGISYANDNRLIEAEKCFYEIYKLTQDTNNYNYKMLTLSKNSLITSEIYKDNWTKQNKINTNYNNSITNEIENLISKNINYYFQINIGGEKVNSLACKYSNHITEYFVQKKEDKLFLFRYVLPNNNDRKETNIFAVKSEKNNQIVTFNRNE